MIFEQLFDTKSSTYTYVISSGEGREALIIDPVIEHTDEYLKILEKLKLKLVKVIDTHIHADHITALNELNKRTSCVRIMGENSKSEVIDLKIKDNEKIKIENIEFCAMQRQIRILGKLSQVSITLNRDNRLKDFPVLINYLIDSMSQYKELKDFSKFLKIFK